MADGAKVGVFDVAGVDHAFNAHSVTEEQHRSRLAIVGEGIEVECVGAGLRRGAELTLLDLDRGRETTFQDPTFANLANECPLAFVPAPPRLVVLDYNAWSFRVPDLHLLGKRPTSPAAFHSLGLPDPPPQPDCGQMIIATHVDPPPARICEREGFPLPLAFCSR